MTATPATASLRQLTLGDLEHETALTRRVLERLPDDQLDFRPHAKSMSMRELGAHLATMPVWLVAMLEGDSFDLAAGGERPPAPATRDEMLRSYDALMARVQTLLDQTDDARLAERWTLRKGDHTIYAASRHAAIRQWGISHAIHHRGQLSVYLRLVGVPVPGLFGPSADEPMG